MFQVSDRAIFSSASKPPDSQLSAADAVVCFSHLRWNFVFQRPQHLMTRFAQLLPVFYVEEFLPDDGPARLDVSKGPDGVTVVTPRCNLAATPSGQMPALFQQLWARSDFAAQAKSPILWLYSPMMLPFTAGMDQVATVYDCMDELANFRFAPPELMQRERQLLKAADVVFTGGRALFEAKAHLHNNIHTFPSSVDAAHFRQARLLRRSDRSQSRPVLGFFGVIDERFDTALLASAAAARPQWDFEIVGPIVKIDPDTLPQAANIRYPGPAPYADLPATLARWDVALMPFAINDATKFISPTKTPEYLAGGAPVVSTPIRDVAREYGASPAVMIAAGPAEFVSACDTALEMARGDRSWLTSVDAQLAKGSWDSTFHEMKFLIEDVLAEHCANPPVMRPAWRARRYDLIVVGAGFAGSVSAERAAADGKRVLLIDKRPHLGGNAYDEINADGLLVHRYGPHIFHTNCEEIFTYLSRFTQWRPYEHRVLAHIQGQLTPIPINRTTLNQLYGAQLKSDADAQAFLEARAELVSDVRTSEDVVVAAVGRELYETFFRGYTRKQWGLDPSELDSSVAARVPTRFNTDDRYFTDRYQAMPLHGYTRLFENMVDHPGITFVPGTEWRDVMSGHSETPVIFTGPVDEYFGFRFGALPYRSLKFEHETLDMRRYQPVGTVNYPDEAVPFTRITEFKHLTGQDHAKTSIVREFACAKGDPFYPIPCDANQQLYKKYEALARQETKVTFVGRLASYRYYNMDQVIGQALAAHAKAHQRSSRTVSRVSP